MEVYGKSLEVSQIHKIYRISQKVSTCSAYLEVAPMDLTSGQGFPNSAKGWGKIPPSEGELEILLGEIFLPGDGNLRRSDFDNSNLFQS